MHEFIEFGTSSVDDVEHGCAGSGGITVPGLGADTTTQPRLLPELESVVFIAANMAVAGIHVGGYLYRLTSSMSIRSVRLS